MTRKVGKRVGKEKNHAVMTRVLTFGGKQGRSRFKVVKR